MRSKNSDSSRRSTFVQTLYHEWALVGAVIFGTGLRLYQLPKQILFGDEWHGIIAAPNLSYFQIASSFGISDRSIPITLYYKLASDWIGLDEVIIRMPFALAGILIILIFPLLVRGFVGRFTSNLFAWLLALSPPLIFYSRIARPYSIAVLCGFSAVILFYRWWMRPDWRRMVLYVILAAVTGYLLLVSLPWVLGPFPFFFALSFLSPHFQISRSIKRLLFLGCLTLSSMLLLVGPPLYLDFTAISSKAGYPMISPSNLIDAFRVLSGMESPLLTIIIFLLVIAGLIKTYREKRRFAIYLLTLSLIQPITLLILRPLGSTVPIIFARYMLLILPALLIFAAAGVEAVLTVFGGSLMKWTRPVLTAALCAVLFLGGPVPSATYTPNNATSLVMLLHALKGKGCHQVLKKMPRFYVSMAAHPPASLTIAEAPFHWQADHLALYQKIHRQNVVMGLTGNLCGQEGKNELPILGHAARFKTIVDLKNVNVLSERGIDFVVFHKQMENEIHGRLPDYLPRDISGCIEHYRARFGRPFFEDDDIIVFEVERD